MKKPLLIPIFLMYLSFFSVSCLTSPQFERINPEDPSSDLFRPTFFNFQNEIIANESVSLLWIDQTDYETGYILKKEFDNSGFIVVDTLPPSQVGRFTDDSKEFDVPTRYLLESYIIKGDTVTIGMRDTTSVFFGLILNTQSYIQNDSVFVSWVNTIKIPHKIVISVDETPVDTLDSNSTLFGFKVPEQSSNLTIKLEANILNFQNLLKPLQSVSVVQNF